MSNPIDVARAAELRRERAAPRYNRTGYTGRLRGSTSGADTPGPHSFTPDPSRAASRLAKAAGSAGVIGGPNGARGMRPSIIDIQRFLHNRGYDIAVDGKMGPQTQSALADWHKGKGTRNPAAWSARHGLNPSPVFKSAHPGAHFAGGGGGGGGPTDPPPADPTSALLASLMAGAGKVGSMIPASTADAMAGMQFDPQIHDLEVAMAKAPRQNAQNLSDIGNFYGQVRGSLKTAAARDAAGYAAGKTSLGDAVNAIVSSLGGSANGGSATVGAAGADAVGTLGALAQADSQFQNDMQPLLAAEAAGQKSQELARQSQRSTDVQAQLEDLLGQRGQAKSAALADILDKNNSLAQQRFANRAGLLNTLAAMQTAGIQSQMKGIDLALKAKKLAAPPPGTFAAASPASKSKVAQSITQALIDPTTHQRLSSVPDYHRAAQIAADIVRSNGWAATNPAVIQQLILPALHTAGFYPPPGFFSGRAA